MTAPRVWISPTASARAMRVGSTRHHVEPRVAEARHTAVAWAASPGNGERLGRHLGARHAALPPYGGNLAEISELLMAWNVPGVRPPADISAGMSARWARSVTAGVLRQLRRDGLLDQPARIPPRESNSPVAARQSGLGCAEQDGETARAGARSTETKVAAMADSPRPSRDTDEVPTQFAAVPLQVEAGNPYLQRLDAQAAVDLARQRHTAARRALVTATEGGAPVSVSSRAVAATADDARVTLRAAVGVLRSLTTLHRVDVSATIEIEVQVDGPLTVIRPRGELDLFTSPHLERACVDRLDAARVGRMVVDLTAVTFLDSSGLAVLVEIRRTCLEGGTTFALTGLSDRSRRLLAITRLDTVFDVT